MNIQFVTNKSGKVSAVQLSIKEWEEVSRKAAAYDIAESIRQGMEEVGMIERGEIQPKTLKKLLDEL